MRTKKESAPSEALPESFDSLEAFWEFWDLHSSADYEDLMEPVEVEMLLRNFPSPLPSPQRGEGASSLALSGRGLG